ncbi:SEN1 N terminal-domain-containing protein [Echria macrotheca]|uniref:SEN1 N terminal-domain-containing protein n=1 Tax=Echria macrotheca TaxID=438768 RepID=A0AAJ0BHZ2_9PEZI|nr:SEN1 N terminal-domain-containing protein [Echria macrotheca]
MMQSEPLYSALVEFYNEFKSWPPGAHMFCPKINDEDTVRYDDDVPAALDGISEEEKKNRMTAFGKRLIVGYRLSLLLGIRAEDASTWQGEWSDAANLCLTSCDACARNWHSQRDKFLKALEGDLPAESVDYMQQKLNQFDKDRIDRGLRRARTILEEKGPMNTSKLAVLDTTSVLALFEALCCMTYLAQPDNREDFNYVFENTQLKKPLRTSSGIIPTMTFFLFDENPYRFNFAKAAWGRKTPGSLTTEEWDWSISSQLEVAILSVSIAKGLPSADKICRFWRGVEVMLPAFSERQIDEFLRGMELSPNIYFLALEHLVTDSPKALAAVLRGQWKLMEKSTKAFWAAYDHITPSQMVEEIFKSSAFRPFLASSLSPESMEEQGAEKTPLFAVWIKSFINSLEPNRRSDVCESLLRHLFETFRRDPRAGPEAQATSTLAGLVALEESLNGYLRTPFDTGTALIMVNQLLNRVVQYQDVIISASQLKTGDRYNAGLSKTAMSIIHSSLALDAKATCFEWSALNDDIPVQDAVNRDSGGLWEAFLEMLWSGQTELAKAMLLATMPLQNIEKFIPKRKETLAKQLEKFNNRFSQQTAAISRVFFRLSDFTPADLHMFCSDSERRTIDPIAASLFHGEDSIREAGMELVKAVTTESEPLDAVAKMLEEYLTPFLTAFTGAVKNLLGEKANRRSWTHMQPLLRLSGQFLYGLCDPGVGQVRLRSLTPADKAVIREWWDCQWQMIGHSFQNMRQWHVRVEKKTMEDFCRDVMEFADKLLAQDGLLASALSQAKDGDTDGEAMKTVLDPPSRHSSCQLVQMLQLRDKYLVQTTIDVIKKLVARLGDNGMVLPAKTKAILDNILKKVGKRDGSYDYPIKTNLTDAQRIELLKALGDDAAIDELFVKPVEEQKQKEKALRQSRLDFSKASSASLAASVKSHLDELTPHSDKRKSALDALKPQKPILKAAPKPTLNAEALKEARAREKAEKQKRDAEAIAKAKALRAPPRIVPGEGSGLQGIVGVRGKDHAPELKDEIMVGSSDDDHDEEDSGEDEILSGKAVKGKKAVGDASRLQLLAAPRRPVQKQKVQRSLADLRARIVPPMDVLHQAILEWDIFHEGNDPPSGYRCDRVSDTYTDPRSYKQTFFPLLVYEAWRSFVTDKNESTAKPFGIKVLNRMTVDKFMEVTVSLPPEVSRSKDRVTRERLVSEGDIVLISRGSDPLNQPEALHCLARIWKVKMKPGAGEVIFRLSAKGNPILSAMLPAAEFNVVKITNMTTIEREYAALESLQYYDLAEEILKAEPSPMLNFPRDRIQTLIDVYNLNPGQAKAILNAKENDGFTLVQGPPGTGKTKTIVAMVGCLLTHVLQPAGAVAISKPGSEGPPPRNPAKKLLVCAPSNAAVDELVIRLKAGVKTMNGSFHRINVVRVGRSEAVNTAVKDVTLEELVKIRFNATTDPAAPSAKERMHQEAGELKAKVNELRPQLEAARASGDRQLLGKLQREFDDLRARQAHIGAKIEADKASGDTAQRESDIKRRQIQQDILDKAQVLCTTLSGSGHDMFRTLTVEFETVIIDEAAQCVELSALIPLKYGCSKCILVGDPKQLPPTVLSQSAARYGYDQSLFVRMQKRHAKDVHLLDTQYRMHPEISMFPSKEFYEGLLQNGPDMASLRRQDWHRSVLLGPYRFFDVKGSQNRGPRGQSLINDEEVKVAMQLYRRFKVEYSGLDLTGKIGVITPYKAQLFRLRQRFEDTWGESIFDEIEFNTTDAFQGRECEIIIFSCVRASPTGGIGFMTDIRRMNVGLTRARSSIWILGDSRALVQGEFWGKLIEDAKRRDRYTAGNILAMLNRPLEKLPAAAWEALAVLPTNPALEPRVEELVSDVDMPDAPPISPQQLDQDKQSPEGAVPATSAPVPHAPSSKPSPDAHPAAPTARAEDRSTVPHRPSLGGLNERGEAVQGAPRGAGHPMIQTSSSSGKKRQLESDGGQPGAKKVQQRSDTNLGPSRTPREQKAAIDPSAMEVLGLVPPSRPAAPTTNRGPSGSTGPGVGQPSGGPGGGPANGPRAPMMPPKKKAADPFIRRKPNKRP